MRDQQAWFVWVPVNLKSADGKPIVAEILGLLLPAVVNGKNQGSHAGPRAAYDLSRALTVALDVARVRGSVRHTRNPRPSRFSNAIRPPCASTISRTSAKPRPVPLRLVE